MVARSSVLMTPLGVLLSVLVLSTMEEEEEEEEMEEVEEVGEEGAVEVGEPAAEAMDWREGGREEGKEGGGQ